MGYISVPIETNPEILTQDIYALIQATYPAWRPNDGNLDTMIIRALAAKAAEIRTLASDVPDLIYMNLGSTLYSTPPNDAVAATGDTTWTLSDTLGHTIQAGTVVGIPNSAGELVNFRVLANVVVLPGASVTAAGEVAIQALLAGVDGNDLDAVPVLVNAIDWVQSIALVAPTSGGADAETVDDYLDRFSKKLRRLSLVPILPADFESAALDADPGVYRAVAIDGYNPDDLTYNNPRMVTIAAVDINGDGVSGTIETAIETYIDSLREVNWIVKTMSPNYTEIDVSTDIIVSSGYDSTTTETNVESAITDYLSKAKWGTSVDDPRAWTERGTLYRNELISLVDQVEGVDRVSTLTLAIHGDPLGVLDITLVSPASLTTAGTITATAV